MDERSQNFCWSELNTGNKLMVAGESNRMEKNLKNRITEKGESYCRWLRSFLLHLFEALINSLVCWFLLIRDETGSRYGFWHWCSFYSFNCTLQLANKSYWAQLFTYYWLRHTLFYLFFYRWANFPNSFLLNT